MTTTPLNQKSRDEKRALQKQELENVDTRNDSEEKLISVTLDYFPSFHNPAYILAGILEDIIKDKVKYFSLDSSSVENELSKMTVSVPKLLIELRQFYIGLYEITGLSEKEIMESLLKKFRFYDAEDGSNIITYAPYSGPKPSPYAS